MSHRLVMVLLLAVFLQATAYHVHIPETDQQNLKQDVEVRYIDGIMADKGEFPFQVGMYLDELNFCGGSLISTRWILTSAQCVELTKIFTVYLGALEIHLPAEDGRIILTTRTGIKHEEFHRQLLHNNVGLVQLPTDIQPSNQIGVIAMAPRSFEYNYDFMKAVTIIGWGSLEIRSKRIRNRLQYVARPLEIDELCKLKYGNKFTDNIVCTYNLYMDGVCTDDDGGPMVIRDRASNKTLHIGVASFMPVICSGPLAYTKTPMFLDWISKKTGIPIEK